MTYEKANENFNAAIKAFNKVRDAFTNINIPMNERPTHAEYDAALKVYKAAEKEYDAAFAKEVG